MIRNLALFFGLALLAGCSSTYQPFHAVGPGGDLEFTADYHVNSVQTQQRLAAITIEAVGRRRFRDPADEDRRIDVVRLRIGVDNTSDREVAVPLEDVVARDGLGGALRPIHRAMPSELADPQSRLLVVPPFARTEAEVAFEVGPAGSLDDLDSFSATWSYAFPDGTGRTHTARFLPVVYRRQFWGPPVSVGFFYSNGFFCW